ncbi:hypothetical protein E2I00_010829, partial [Balaenoptera physalus]
REQAIYLITLKMYNPVTDQVMKTVESHPNIQLEFTFYHLPGQYVAVNGPGMLPHLVEGVGMALPLSRPQFLQRSFPCQTGCGEYISRWSQPLIKGKCLHYPLGSKPVNRQNFVTGLHLWNRDPSTDVGAGHKGVSGRETAVQACEPRPWRLVDDCGGAFAVRTVGGGIFQALEGFRSFPVGGNHNLGGSLTDLKTRAPQLGGSFAVWGGLTAVWFKSEGKKIPGIPSQVVPEKEPF